MPAFRIRVCLGEVGSCIHRSVTQGDRRRIPDRYRRRVYADFGETCLIPECPTPSRLPDGTPLLEIAYIASPWPGGPRADVERSVADLSGVDNLILVCPSHHKVIDSLPQSYSVSELRRLRVRHLELVAQGALRRPNVAPAVPSPDTASRLQKALSIWEAERENASEEFWQTLFTHRPELLKLVTQGRPFVLNSKCYVGGKAIDNRGGQVVDFLAQCSGDAILIEIKTPTAALMGREYRANVHPPSPELAGAVAQALNYRLTLLNEMAMLSMNSPGLIAHHPSIVVIVGDVDRAELSAGQRRSFELYRQSMKDILVVTYDELFTSLADLAILMEPDAGM